MFKFVLRLSSIMTALVALSAHTSAQDYRGQEYRVQRLQPREMVYQAPPQKTKGFFEMLFGGNERETTAYYPPERGNRYQQIRPQNNYINPDTLRGAPTIRRASEDNYTRRPSVPKASVSGANLYCVRSCDGFFFPLAGIKGEAKDSLTQAEACSSLCPGTPTELYKMTSGHIETMVGPNRKAYSSHPKAFAFREKIEQSCSCKGVTTGGLARLPHTRDYTLREGDVIVLQSGAHVFDGGDGFPYKEKDFIMANRGGRLSKDLQAMLVAKNISLGVNKSNQIAAGKSFSMTDTAVLDIDFSQNAAGKPLRMIEILAIEKQRPKLMIDIIQSRRSVERL